MGPLQILFIGLAVVIGLIIVGRLPAFLALLLGALTVSFLTGGTSGNTEWVDKVTRVVEELGTMTGRIGVLIVMGAIIGRCLTASGSADRIVLALGRLFGQKQVPAAFLCSGFVLSIPVFYDTTLFLLLPLARTYHHLIRKNAVLLLTAVAAGATISHGLIPPTPGPLVIAQQLNLSVATMLGFGLLVGTLLTPFALAGCYFVNWYLPNPRLLPDENAPNFSDSADTTDSKSSESPKTYQEFFSNTNTADKYPSLFWAMAPIVLPVFLIATSEIYKVVETQFFAGSTLFSGILRHGILVLGNPNIALILAATVAAGVYYSRQRRQKTGKSLKEQLETAIQDAGTVILITAAGGAFGAMLRVAQVGPHLATVLFGNSSEPSGTGILILAFCLASLIKTSQGSSTTAMITTAGILNGIAFDHGALGFHPGYLGVTIGLGAMVTGWMNDSGFWVFCRMSRLDEVDALKTWSVLLAMIGITGFGIVLVLTRLLPFS